MTEANLKDASALNFNSIREAFERRVFEPREVPFPGAEKTKLRVRLLRESELDAVRIQAVEYVKGSRLDTIVDRDRVLGREERRQMVWRAFLAAGAGDVPFFPSDGDVRALDEETIDRLYETYLHHQAEVADASLPSDADLDRAIDVALEAGDDAIELLALRLDARGLRALTRRLAGRLRSSSEG